MELADSVPTAGLDPTNTTWAQVQAMGQATSAAEWKYTRDVEGSVLSVDRLDVTGQAPRFEGYQLEWYKLDGSGSGGMTHDGAGRVTTEFGRTYAYDDFHALVRAGATSGSAAQGFQYDGVGRLIAVRRGTAGWPVEEEVAYDGTQMVAGWDGAGTGTWSATWGQGVDNLVSVKPAPDAAEVMALKDGRGSVVGYYRGEATTPGLWVTADYTPEGAAGLGGGDELRRDGQHAVSEVGRGAVWVPWGVQEPGAWVVVFQEPVVLGGGGAVAV
jgi:hypothetical protein